MLTRHDIPQEVKDVIDVAIREYVIDTKEVYVLALKHGDNWYELISDIVESAYAWRYVDSSVHEAVVTEAEKFWRKYID